ncbi:MAG: flavodoxin family protein [Actinomycetia bacterium]|nr:flavodoxin family protein [Actinomycetes bacterium]
MSQPVVLGFAGSPRRRGNSEQMLDACLAGAEDAGARVHKLVPAEMSIHWCRGCNGCSRNGACVVHDQMYEVYEAVDAAAAIVFATPVYFASVPGVLKVMLDRMQPYWARTHVLKQPRPPRRPGGLLLVRSGGDPYGFPGAEYPLKSVCGVLGIDIEGEVKTAGADAAGDVSRQPLALDRARSLGARIGAASLGGRLDA